ncbi:MAG: PCRF domain-containing protein, partial [Proteobacteria bacterium]|nr:PCRF domain-containing protein [Pseudomonadota bacterium]
MQEVERELEQPNVWEDPSRAQDLGRERARLEAAVGGLDRLTRGFADSAGLLELAEAEADSKAADEIGQDVELLAREVEAMEFSRMFPGEMDSHNA